MAVVLKILVALFFFQAPSGEAAICPAGHYCPSGTTVPIPCPPGTQSRFYVNQRTTCQNCARGYYQDKSGQANCLVCPEGHSCADARTRPVPCSPGTISMFYVSDRTACANCSNGRYQDKPGQKECLTCPRGHKCPVPRTHPIPCPPGTMSKYYVHDRISCAECSRGFYQEKPGQDSCLPCPLGRYCPSPSTRAIECPAGTVNRYYVSDRVSCESCSNGLYQDKTGQTTCLLCPEGHKCPSPKNDPTPCLPGFQNGQYRYTNYLVNCLACSAGFYQANTGQARCIECPDRHSCPQKDKQPVPCPQGFTSSYFVSERVGCVKCSPGKCLDPVPHPVVCQPGMFLDRSTKSCRPCQAGQYQVQPGQSSCQICPEGFYCPTTTAKPIPCSIGTYSTKWMGVRTACTDCSIGTYQVKLGQNFCLQCPPGHFCPRPSVNPVPCPTGTYATSFTTDRTKCLPCSSREYQDQPGQQSCKPCPDGHMCPEAGLSPQQCPPNTYSTIYQTDRSKCLPCPRGQYQDQCGQQGCKAIFTDGTIPTPEPSLTCQNLSTSSIVAEHQMACTEKDRGSYSGSSVRLVKGNNKVQYPVLRIREEHLTKGTSVTDNEIALCTAIVFDKMASAAKADGVTITITSGFRSLERQIWLHECYKTKKCNDGNLAASPGTSKHGTGVALDLNTNCGKQTEKKPPAGCADSAVYVWLKRQAHKYGFVRTVRSEPWHWEFQGGPVAGASDIT